MQYYVFFSQNCLICMGAKLVSHLLFYVDKIFFSLLYVRTFAFKLVRGLVCRLNSGGKGFGKVYASLYVYICVCLWVRACVFFLFRSSTSGKGLISGEGFGV